MKKSEVTAFTEKQYDRCERMQASYTVTNKDWYLSEAKHSAKLYLIGSMGESLLQAGETAEWLLLNMKYLDPDMCLYFLQDLVNTCRSYQEASVKEVMGDD